MNVLLATITLLLVALTTAQGPPPRPIGSGGAGAVGPGSVDYSVEPEVQLPGGPSSGPGSRGDFVPGQLDSGRRSGRGPGGYFEPRGRTVGLYGRRGGSWHRPPGGGFFSRTGPPTIFHKFPSCHDIDMDIRETYEEMWIQRQIGPKANRCNIQNFHECMYRDMNAARCSARIVPTEQCIQEVMAYVKGTNCGSQATTTFGTTFDDTTFETGP